MNENYKKLYYEMLRIRRVQEKIESLYHLDEMKTPVHLCIGEEASAVGVCANLNKDDYVFSNHRGHGHYLAKGGDLKALIAELYCKRSGCSKGKGGSMHIVDISVGLMGSSSIVSGGIPIAVGAALSVKMKKENKVSVSFFGDGASEEGVMYESMNFAKLKNLPVVFVCENNFYSVCSHQSAREANADIYLRAKPFNIPAYQVDASRVLDVYNVAKKAINDARCGRGPSFIECKAYRFRAHAGAGDADAAKYRKADEAQIWLERCPVKLFEEYLIKEKFITEEELSGFEKAIDKEIGEAFFFAQKSPLPEKEELYEDLFAM